MRQAKRVQFMARTTPFVFEYLLILALSISGQAQTTHPHRQDNQRKALSKTPNQKELTPRQIATIAYPSTVSIYVFNNDGDVYSGAGFIIAPGVVATCFHIVENARRIIVTPMGEGEDKHLASILRQDEERDIALLQVKTLKRPPIKLFRGSDLYIGETIYTLGNPKGLEGTFSNGITSNFIEEEETFYMQFTAPVSPGSSGGPVLNTNGEVIGIVNMQLKEGQNLNFAVLWIHVALLLDDRRDFPSKSYIDKNMAPQPTRRPNL